VRGILLYGPFAAGKDTITAALHAMDARYVQFPRVKVGGNTHGGYRNITEAELDAYREHGDIIWENRRYGAVYAVDRSELERRLNHKIPIVHLGQIDALVGSPRNNGPVDCGPCLVPW
jgi:guanylate kinase